MIEETATVVGVDNSGVWVETVKNSACGSCAARNGCGQKLLASSGAGKRFVINVLNPSNISVQPQDSVLIGIEEGAFIKATLYVYLLPLIALFVGAFIAQQLALPEGYVILSALGLMCISLLMIRFGSAPLFRSCKYQPILMKII
jgi:sigma-E factor negative regulatory protein RseC